MKYMLDTNICVFLINKRSDRLIDIFYNKQSLGVAISAVTLSELEYGVYASAYVEKNLISLQRFLLGIDILAFDESAAIDAGKIRAQLRKRGEPIGPNDALIAAHAKSLGLILVTNNTREFMRVDDLSLEDWSI